MSRFHRLFAAVLLGLAALGSTPAAAGKADDTLVYSLREPIDNLSSYFNSLSDNLIISRQLFDNLLYRDPKTGDFVPQLAKSWRWVNDTTLEFVIRDGIKWHDGAHFSADDVVFTVNYLANPDLKIETRARASWMKSAEKIGNDTVHIHMTRAFPAAPQFVATYLVIYPKAHFEKVGIDAFKRHPIGTGPYKIKSFEPGKPLLLERNRDYFKDSPIGMPSIANVRIMFIPEVQSRVAQLMVGQVDLIGDILTDQMRDLGKVAHLAVASTETEQVGYLFLDAIGRSGDTPLKNLKVRQAIAHAINREAIARNLIGPNVPLAKAACTHMMFGCTDKVATYAYDPAKAKQLLAEAGHANGFDTAFIYLGERRKVYMEAIFSDLRQIGVRVSPQLVTFPAYVKQVYDGTAQMGHGVAGGAAVFDASVVLGAFFDGGGRDFARDPAVIAAVKEGGEVVDPQRRKAAYAKALERIAEQVYWVPLWSNSMNYAFSKDLAFEPPVDNLPVIAKMKWR